MKDYDRKADRENRNKTDDYDSVFGDSFEPLDKLERDVFGDDDLEAADSPKHRRESTTDLSRSIFSFEDWREDRRENDRKSAVKRSESNGRFVGHVRETDIVRDEDGRFKRRK